MSPRYPASIDVRTPVITLELAGGGNLAEVRAFIILGIVASSQLVAAEPLAIAVVGATSGFSSALANGLSPYRASIIEAVSGGERDEIVRMRAVAAREHAHVVVWLEGNTLAVYEAASDRMLSRMLPDSWRPDPVGNTEAARAVRVMLRALRRSTFVAPVPSTPQPAITLPPDRVVAARSPSRPRLVIGLGIGFARELELAGVATWQAERLGATLSVETTRGELAGDGFRGELATQVIAACGRVRFARGAGYELAAIGGLAAHVGSLEGELMTGVDVGARRVDPSLRTGVVAGLGLGRFELGVSLLGDTMLRRARYVVTAGEVAEMAPFQLVGLVTVGVGIR